MIPLFSVSVEILENLSVFLLVFTCIPQGTWMLNDSVLLRVVRLRLCKQTVLYIEIGYKHLCIVFLLTDFCKGEVFNSTVFFVCVTSEFLTG